MKPFTESMLYEFPLTADSTVLDIGGYEGVWLAEMNRRYGCHFEVYEPRNDLALQLEATFKEFPKIKIHNLAIGRNSRSDRIRIKGSMTGFWANDGPYQDALVISIGSVLAKFHEGVGLLSINCEGSEFEILEAVLEYNLAPRINNMIVQFHDCAPDCERRFNAIMKGMSKTHDVTFNQPFIWTGFKLR